MADSTPENIGLQGYLRPLRSRWWIVLLIAVLAEGFTYQYFSGKPTTYVASTALLLQPPASSSGDDPERAAREQAVIIGTRKIARRVAQELRTPGGLPGVVAAAPSEGTNFLTLTARSSNPRSAVDLVNAYARVYIRYSGEAARAAARKARLAAERQLRAIPNIARNRESRSQLQASIQNLTLQESGAESSAEQVEPAVAAQSVKASPARNAIFALALGALLGLGIVYGLEHLDRRLKRLEEIDELFDRPVLVAVPGAPRAAKASSTQLKLEPPMTEAFRTLRTNLQLPGVSSGGDLVAPPRTILVASALSGEGKSTVARNLALAYYEAGLRVVLVDADLRRSTLAENFGIAAEPGLAEVLHGAPLGQALHVVWQTAPDRAQRAASSGLAAGLPAATLGARAEHKPRSGPLSALRRPPQPRVASPPAASTPDANSSNGVADGSLMSVLTSGRVPSDPAALLASGPFAAVLRDLEADHDIVVVDTAPLLPVSDAVPLLSAVDGVLIVSRIGATTRHAAGQLSDLLARIPNVNVLGVVANDVREEPGYGSGGYGYGDP